MRKESGLDVTDRIDLRIKSHASTDAAIRANKTYICTETLADSLDLVDEVVEEGKMSFEVEEGIETELALSKI